MLRNQEWKYYKENIHTVLRGIQGINKYINKSINKMKEYYMF